MGWQEPNKGPVYYVTVPGYHEPKADCSQEEWRLAMDVFEGLFPGWAGTVAHEAWSDYEDIKGRLETHQEGLYHHAPAPAFAYIVRVERRKDLPFRIDYIDAS